MRRKRWIGVGGSSLGSWIVACAILTAPFQAADAQDASDPVFSGPQVGEPLPALPIQLVLAEDPTKQVDVTGDDSAPPRLVVFVHSLTRPSPTGSARVWRPWRR